MDAADAWLAARRAPAAAPPPVPSPAAEPTGDAADSWLSSRGVERPRRSQSFDALRGPGATDPEPSGPLYTDRFHERDGKNIVSQTPPGTLDLDPIAQGVVSGVLTAPISAAMPLVARAVGPALARPVVAATQGAAGAAMTGGNPLAGAALGAAPAALGAARQIAVGGAGARVQSRLVGDVTGEGGKTRAPKRVGDKIAAKAGDEGERLDATLRELPELRKQIAVHAQGNPGKTMRAVDDTLDVLTPQNDAVFDVIDFQHGGIPLGDMVKQMKNAEIRLNAAGKAIEADAAGAVRADIVTRYGHLPKLNAEAIRNYRNDLGAIAFKGNPNVPPTAKAAGLSRVYDEMYQAIEMVAAKTEGVDMAAFKARNRQIATLIPVRDALKERAAAQSQGKRALGETVKAAVLPLAMGSSFGLEGAAIGAGLYGAGKLGANLARRGDYRLAQLAERFPIAGAQNPATDAAIGMGAPGAVGAADNVPTLDPAIIARLRAFTGQGAPNGP